MDCSDHEVNIKILLNQLVAEARIDSAARDRLLDEMSAEVAEIVLRNNDQQSKMLSQSNRTAAMFIAKHAHLIQLFERKGRLDWQFEQLPDDAQLKARMANQESSPESPSLETRRAVDQQIETLEYIYYAFDIPEVATQTGRGLDRVAQDFFAFNRRLDLFELRRDIDQLPSFDKWHRKIKQALISDVDRAVKQHLIRLISSGALDTETTDDSVSSAVSHTISQFHERVSEVRSQPSRHLAMLAYLCRSIEELDFGCQ